MYPEEPNTGQPIPGTAIAALVAEFIAPIRDAAITHRRELIEAGLDDSLANHLTYRTHEWLLDQAHHLLDQHRAQEHAPDQEDVQVVEMEGPDAQTVLDAIAQAQKASPTEWERDPRVRDAIRDAVRRKFQQDTTEDGPQ